MRLATDTKLEDSLDGGHQRPYIMFVLLTLGMVPVEFLIAFGRMQMPMNGKILSNICKGYEVGKARNNVVEHILNMPDEERPKYLFFLGDDMIPPWDGAMKMHEEMERGHWDILTGLYFWKGEPPTPVAWRKNRPGRFMPGRDYKLGEVVYVDMVGFDFTFIRTSFLERLKKEVGPPYFKTGPSQKKNMPDAPTGMEGEGIVLHTEDVWMCEAARKIKAHIGLHTGVRVGHFDFRTGMIY